MDNSLYANYVANGAGLFGAQSLRVSNAYTEPSGEFLFQTYSKSTAENAGEGLNNTVYTGEFQFIPTTDQFQPNLYVRVSPDNGTGGRMSFVGLRDVQDGVNDGIQMTFFDTDAAGAFVPHPLGVYPRDEVHSIKFSIKFVDGPANDIVRLFVDGNDMGEELNECFTTWEQFYREVSHESVPVTNSIEFRVQGDGNTFANLVGGGYLFDNVTNTTADVGGPAPTVCGTPPVDTATLNVTKFYDANANGTKDAGEGDITGWKVEVENGSTQSGTTPFTASGLAPGDYIASEFAPNEANWFATTDTSVPVTLAAGQTKSVSFGNVCTGDGGGLTIGFWGNKAGLALITGARPPDAPEPQPA